LKQICSNVFENEFYQFSNALKKIIFNVNILFNFEKEWHTFDKENGHLKKKTIVIIVLNMQKGS
jgi:hypothetical protein